MSVTSVERDADGDAWAFESREDIEKWESFGSVEGLREAVGQMDPLLSRPS